MFELDEFVQVLLDGGDEGAVAPGERGDGEGFIGAGIDLFREDAAGQGPIGHPL